MSDSGGRKDDGVGVLEALRWLATTEHGAVVFAREVVTSIAVVGAVGLLLFAVSGLWPPMVAVESPSMHPNMKTGDLVFVMEEHRLAPKAAHAETGVVTYRAGEDAGYKKFNKYGDVIVYKPSGNVGTTPIIHRARFWVEDGEDWYDEANPQYIGGADNCQELLNCPAPHAGFITKGDNNPRYDQVGAEISSPVRPQWVIGTAEFRIPWLGYVRLGFARTAAGTTATPSLHLEPNTDTTAGTINSSAEFRNEAWRGVGTAVGA